MKEYLIFIAVPIVIIGGGTLLKRRRDRKVRDSTPGE
jgi:hypothetical protein